MDNIIQCTIESENKEKYKKKKYSFQKRKKEH
jgi:hypothetical protein